MEDGVNSAVDAPRAGHVVDAQREMRVALEVIHVSPASRDQVVDTDNVGAVSEHAVRKMGPEKARAAGHHNARRGPAHWTASRSGVLVTAGCCVFGALGLRVGRPTPMYVK